MNSRAFLLLPAAVLLWAGPAAPQQETAPAAAQRIDVTLERLAAGRWSVVDPKTVLDAGDRIRFRFRSSTAGWLYVYCTGSGGQADWLLPAAGSVAPLVPKDSGYEVPSESAGSYAVSGPPGFDMLYWILSPQPIPAESLVPASVRRRLRTRSARAAAPLVRTALIPLVSTIAPAPRPGTAPRRPSAKRGCERAN